jgi:hypothetical protein
MHKPTPLPVNFYNLNIFKKMLEDDVTSSFIIYLTKINATYNDADASNFYNKRLEIDIL